jgi:hypothetical protein
MQWWHQDVCCDHLGQSIAFYTWHRLDRSRYLMAWRFLGHPHLCGAHIAYGGERGQGVNDKARHGFGGPHPFGRSVQDLGATWFDL